MKKSIFLILTFLLIAGAAESQVKVNFSLSNPRMEYLPTMSMLPYLPDKHGMPDQLVSE
jgi:hypothetical protein